MDARILARYLDRDRLPLRDRILELWFAPKRFESPRFYERLGVKYLKRYVPTGGDYFIQRYGARIIDVHGDLESMVRFERRTRLYEAIHTTAFIGFSVFSFWRWRVHQTSFFGFLFAMLVYVLLIFSPVPLQRYNRLRIYRAISILAKRDRSNSGLRQSGV